MGKLKKRRRSRARSLPLRLAREIFDRLERMHAELCRRRSAETAPLEAELNLPAHLGGADRDEASRTFAAALVATLGDQVAQNLASTVPFFPGCVYCFWCDSATCHHAVPPAPRSVFSGYDPTGLPRWEDLASLCLHIGDARVDRLHRDPPRPFTLFMPGKDLHRDQLTEFGSQSSLFAIHGQALVGYLPFDDRESLGTVALTLQVVETQVGRTAPRLAFNVIGKAVSGEDFGVAVERHADRRPADVFARARRQLADLGTRRPGADRDREIESLLKHSGANLERICRQESRRTKHARMRHRDPSRPAGAALKDVKRAKTEDFYRDRRRGTSVIVGPRSRAHFFNDQGRHVTSLVYRGDDIVNRVQTKQWIPLEAGECEQLRERILAAGTSERAAQ